MQRLVPFFLATLLFGACDSANDPAAPNTDAPTAFAASQFTDNGAFPLDMLVYVPCAAAGSGEWVHLTGTLHTLFHVTVSSSGNFKVKGHFQPQGVSGTGETTGGKYQGTGVTQDIFHSGRVGLTYSLVNNFRIIGQGSGNNFLVHEVFHITVNANGTLTAFVDGFKVGCK